MSDDIARLAEALKNVNGESRDRRLQINGFKTLIKELQATLAERDKTIGELQSQIGEYEEAVVELDDLRQELQEKADAIPAELEAYRERDFVDQHKEAFNSMMQDVSLHPQASLEQLWQMVGYDPHEVEELSPELVGQVLDAAKEQAPFLFMGKDVAQTIPQNAYLTGPQSAARAMQNGFVQPTGFTSRQTAPMQQTQQAPAGWSSVTPRGAPVSPPPQAVRGRFQDPKWIAENQKQIAEMVEAGVQFIGND